MPIIVHGFRRGQTGTADFGDAQEEGVPIGLYRVPATVTSGSGGTAPTPRLVSATGAAAGFTAEVNNTTVATTSGTLELLDVFTWNVRVPESQLFIPEFRYEFAQATACVIRVITGPADAIATTNGSVLVEEGG